ncbi:MAG: DUF2156 domain-containing protein [Victivallales bacterium]|nr:DUF2156 domain-containing protein [Victivallales bacterium]
MAPQLKNLDTTIEGFQKVEPDDSEFLTSYTLLTKFISCEYNFANLAVWGDLYGISWSSLQGVPLINIGGDDALLFPHIHGLSAVDLRDLSNAMVDHGYSGVITQTPPEFIQANPELAEYFLIEPDADFADYVYDAESLGTLAGGALSKKRNLTAQFRRRYEEPRVVTIEKKLFGACLELAVAAAGTSVEDTDTAKEELKALSRAFNLYDALGLCGVAVFAGDMLAGFAITSGHIDGTSCVHFEKTAKGIKGAAQVVNQETAKRLAEHCRYINREQDLGIPGLRRAKKSYKPYLILTNHNLTPKVA